jgi:hypothetical protein
MNRLVLVAVVLLSACSVVENPNDSPAAASSPIPSTSGPNQDERTSVASEALSGKPTPFFCMEGDVNCCGNGICDAGESCQRCSIDCGPCPPPPTCNGTPGQWSGCRGNGCAVCAENVSNAPCYFQNHPSCARNTTCMGQAFTCNAACPAPSAADFCL